MSAGWPNARQKTCSCQPLAPSIGALNTSCFSPMQSAAVPLPYSLYATNLPTILVRSSQFSYCDGPAFPRFEITTLRLYADGLTIQDGFHPTMMKRIHSPTKLTECHMQVFSSIKRINIYMLALPIAHTARTSRISACKCRMSFLSPLKPMLSISVHSICSALAPVLSCLPIVYASIPLL